MAEKKLGDVVIGLIALIFFVGGFATIISVFDGVSVSNEGYGASLSIIHNNISSVQKNADKELANKYFSNSSFSLTVGSYIDTRGSSEVAIMAKNSPNTIKNFMDLSFKYLLLNKIVSGAIIMAIITIIIILGLRFWRPGGV